MTGEGADLALRGAAIGALAVVAAVMLRQWHARPLGWLGALLALGASCHLLCPFVFAAWGFGLASLPLLVGCVAVPLLFRWFARALFDDRFTWRASDAALAFLVPGLGLTDLYLAASAGDAAYWLRHATGFLFRLVALATIAWTLAESFTGRAADLVEARRRLRLAVVVALGSYMTLVLAAELSLRGDPAPPWLAAANGAGVLALAVGLALALLRGREELAPVPARRASAPDAADEALAQRVRDTLGRERLHREPALTIATLARRLGVQEYRLRRAINIALGFRNFNDFLNRQRIEEVCAALADPGKAHVSVLTIAVEAGFGSLGAFNRAFKAQLGVTPTEYRRCKLAEVREQTKPGREGGPG